MRSPSPARGIEMTKKKEIKNPSAKEKQKKIFDENGKLIISNMTDEQLEDTEKQIERSIRDSMKRAGVKPLSSLDEVQQKKRDYWKKYYHVNREKYKQWNKTWREKQKKETKKS